MGNNFIIEEILKYGKEQVNQELFGKVAKLHFFEGCDFKIDDIDFGKLHMAHQLKCGLCEVITQTHIIYLREIDI